MEVKEVLEQRGNRYGEFKDNADIVQALKDVAKDSPSWSDMKPYQKEAIDMIMHKLGRILCGDPDYDDNFIDIAGYAQLVVDELQKDTKTPSLFDKEY